MNTIRKFDVLIVGAGLNGISLALALAKRSINVALIEAKNSIESDQRVIALSTTSQRIFAALAVWEKIKPHTTPLREIQVSHQGYFGAAHFYASEQQLDAFGYVINAGQLATTLYQTLAELPNVEIILSTKLQAISYDNEINTIEVKVKSGIEKIQANLVVAADGVNSTLRELRKIQSVDWNYEQNAIVAQIQLARSHNHIAYERFTRDGALAMLPWIGNSSTVIWSIANTMVDAVMQQDDNQFLTTLQKQFGYRLGRFIGVGKRANFPLKMRYLCEQIAPGLVFIGNAAHTLHPIAAQGFNLGLRDVALLAQIIIEAKTQNKNPGAITELQNYEKLRKTDQQQTIGFTHQLVRLFSYDLLPVAIARDLGMLALNIVPPAKHIFLKRNMGLTGRLSKLACGIPITNEF